jgi:hypothetical protein
MRRGWACWTRTFCPCWSRKGALMRHRFMYERKFGSGRGFDVTLLGVKVGRIVRMGRGRFYTEAAVARLDDPIIGARMGWVGTYKTMNEAKNAIERAVYQ